MATKMTRERAEQRIIVAKRAREIRENQAHKTGLEKILERQLARPSLKPRIINARVFPRH